MSDGDYIWGRLKWPALKVEVYIRILRCAGGPDKTSMDARYIKRRPVRGAMQKTEHWVGWFYLSVMILFGTHQYQDIVNNEGERTERRVTLNKRGSSIWSAATSLSTTFTPNTPILFSSWVLLTRKYESRPSELTTDWQASRCPISCDSSLSSKW